MKTWILVADRARARLFSTDGHAVPQEIETWLNPEGRALGHELESERAPTTYESVGGARHAIEPHTPLDAKVADRFAHLLAKALEQGRVERAYDRLVLVAAPQFLGKLNAALGEQVHRHVVGEVHKELTALAPGELLRHLPERLFTGIAGS